jgi:hypothetical protein
MMNPERKKITPFQVRAFHKYASMFALALIAFVVIFLFWHLMMPRMDFYNELWAPAYLLIQGKSPYNTASLNPVLPAAWFPMAIGFFFPLGWLAEERALQVWYVFNIFEVALIVYLAQGKNKNLYNTMLLALICFFFPFTLNHINIGQISITVTFGWVLAVYFLKKDQHWLSALFIALALSKPHLGMLIMLGISYHVYLRSGLRAMFSLWLKIGIMCLFLVIPLFVADPHWVADAILSMKKNPPWVYPSLYILFERFFAAWGRALWVVTTLMVVGINFQMWKKLPLKNAAYWSLALAPLTTPYVGSWDFVVLFPLVVFTFNKVDWLRKVFFLAVYGIAWGWMAHIQMLSVSHNHFFWWAPLWFIGALALMTQGQKQKAALEED